MSKDLCHRIRNLIFVIATIFNSLEHRDIRSIIWSVIVLFVISTSSHIPDFDNVLKDFDVHTCFKVPWICALCTLY